MYMFVYMYALLRGRAACLEERLRVRTQRGLQDFVVVFV